MVSGRVVTAVVKRAKVPEVAAGLEPEAAHRETARKAAEAVEKVRTGKLRPFKPTLPMTIEVLHANRGRSGKNSHTAGRDKARRSYGGSPCWQAMRYREVVDRQRAGHVGIGSEQ